MNNDKSIYQGSKLEIKHPYIILVILVSVTFLLAFGRYIWQNDFYIFIDAGSDCADEYYPTYIYMINKIKAGQLSLWNNSCGLGFDTLTRQERVLDPFAIIIVLIGVGFGTTTVAPMLVVTQFIKILLSALLAYKYLDSFKISNTIKVVASYLYGFNSFLIIWGQHYWFGAISIFMILLLIALESWLKHLDNPAKYILCYSLVVGISASYSVYLTYMAVIVASIYICMRYLYLTDKTGKYLFFDIIVNAGKIILATILGLLLAGVAVFSFIDNNLIISARVNTESIWKRIVEYLLHPYELVYYFQLWLRMISSNVIGISSLGASYYGLPMLTISVVGLLFEGEGVWNIWANMKSTKDKVIFGSSVLLIIFLIFVPLGSCILNAFQYPFGRYTFVLMPVFMILFALGLERICIQGKMNYILTGIVLFFEVIALIYSALVFENTPLVRTYIKFVIALNIVVFCLMILSTQNKKNMSALLLFACILIGCALETYMSSSSSERITKDDLQIERRERTERVISELKEKNNGFFRIDKNYNDFRYLGDSLIEGLNITTGYNSVINKNLAKFYEIIWPEVVTDEICKVTATRGYIAEEDTLNIDNVLALLGVKYILSDHELNNLNDHWERIETEEKDVMVYQNMQANSIVTGYNKIISEDEFEEYSDEQRKEIIKSYLVMSNEEINQAGLEKNIVDMNGLTEMKYDNNYSLQMVKDTYFKGSLSVDQDKFLMVSIPYRRGWNVYVDGQKVSIYKGDYGFIAFPVLKGEHLIEIRYENTVYVIGCICSLVTIILWVALYKSNILNYSFHKRNSK